MGSLKMITIMKDIDFLKVWFLMYNMFFYIYSACFMIIVVVVFVVYFNHRILYIIKRL